MKTKFSTGWKSSSQARKQRKYRYNAPLHIRQSFVNAHLSKELKKKHNRRNFRLRKGDSVKVMRGQFKNKSGKVEEVDVKNSRVYVSGIELTKKDGTKTRRPLNPSNLMITEINMEDKIRQKSLERKQAKV